MSPNDQNSDFNESYEFSSSGSTDSESFLEEDIKNCGSHLNKQWEAIERTLYQESGQHVTDPELLKECKLWRDSFPHFRVKGTKIDVKTSEECDEDQEKGIQTIGKHLNLNKLNEKRESIKSKIVGELVERLIAKFGLNKGDLIAENAKTENATNGSKISRKDNRRGSVPIAQKESYWERGKLSNSETVLDVGVSKEEMEKGLCKIFDEWEKSYEISPKKSPLKTLNKTNGKVKFKKPEKTGWVKPDKCPPPSDSLANIAKPFEMTKKIDKKYEGMLERIMERRYNDLDSYTKCQTGLGSSYQETLEKIRVSSGFEDSFRKNLPRINKFSNPWLDRSALNSYYRSDRERSTKKNFRPKITDSSEEEESRNELDDRFMLGLKKEAYKRPAVKSGMVEEISLRRPKPFRPKELRERTQKSSSCGDLPKRNKNMRSRQFKSNGESETKSKVKSTAKSGKMVQNGKGLLPPIESGIICRELTGRPIIGAGKPSSKR